MTVVQEGDDPQLTRPRIRFHPDPILQLPFQWLFSCTDPRSLPCSLDFLLSKTDRASRQKTLTPPAFSLSPRLTPLPYCRQRQTGLHAKLLNPYLLPQAQEQKRKAEYW
ncbi:unnamed protein product, partial [Cuscuta epithymum]